MTWSFLTVRMRTIVLFIQRLFGPLVGRNGEGTEGAGIADGAGHCRPLPIICMRGWGARG